MAVHLGEEIKRVLKDQGRTHTWFADQIHVERTTVYDVFKREHFDTEQLLLISNTLQTDFFKLLSREVVAREPSMAKEPRSSYSRTAASDPAPAPYESGAINVIVISPGDEQAAQRIAQLLTRK